MRKLLFLVILFGFIAKAHATHIIGGSFFYKPLGGNNYEIRLEVYRDCYNGVPLFDDPASVGVFDQNSNLVQTLFIVYDSLTTDTLNFINTPVCFPPAEQICVHRAIYTTIVNLPPIPGGYRLLYQRCCRSGIVSNLFNPGDLGISIIANVPELPNNHSAVLKNALPYFGFVHEPWVFDASATDEDGDSLVYKLTRPLAGATMTDPMPSPGDLSTATPINYFIGIEYIFGPSTFPLEMNPQTGELKALPEQIGFFVVAFEIEEWRNGQLLCTNKHEIAVSFLDGNYQLAANGKVTEASTGTPLDVGKVEIIRRNPLTDELTIVSSDDVSPSAGGLWKIDNIYSSKYLFRAIPDPSSALFATTFPTYSTSAFFWYNAFEYEICSNSADSIDIALRADSLVLWGGNGSFLGKITKESTTIPVANLEIWLMWQGPNMSEPLPKAWTKTNSAGEFGFYNLANGNYWLYVNELNSENRNTNPPQIMVAPENEGKVFGIYHDTTEIVLSGVVGTEAFVKQQIKIAPNPVGDILIIDGFGDAKIQTVTIVGPSGKVLLQENATTRLSVKNLPSGVYYLMLETDGKRLVERFVKI